MSWRVVVISSRCKPDLKMGAMVIRGEDTKRIFLDEIALLVIENQGLPQQRWCYRNRTDRSLSQSTLS